MDTKERIGRQFSSSMRVRNIWFLTMIYYICYYEWQFKSHLIRCFVIDPEYRLLLERKICNIRYRNVSLYLEFLNGICEFFYYLNNYSYFWNHHKWCLVRSSNIFAFLLESIPPVKHVSATFLAPCRVMIKVCHTSEPFCKAYTYEMLLMRWNSTY